MSAATAAKAPHAPRRLKADGEKSKRLEPKKLAAPSAGA